MKFAAFLALLGAAMIEVVLIDGLTWQDTLVVNGIGLITAAMCAAIWKAEL